MKQIARFTILALGLMFALSACHDASTSLGPDAVQFNKGQGKKGGGDPPPQGDIVALGKMIFEDTMLSVGRNQSCQTCHEPSEGFAAPLSSVTARGSVVQGSVAGRFGDRKPPSAAYATLAPLFSGGNNPTGGNFWDGRATGHLLGNPAADQALGPFLNPVEQGLPDEACVVYHMKSYGALYTAVWGYTINEIAFPSATQVESVCTDAALPAGRHVLLSDPDRAKVMAEYDNVALSLAAFEGSSHVNRFSSRFDRGLMTPEEQEGEKLFGSKGKCQQCHSNKGSKPLFTDFAFHNLGVPKNPASPIYHLGTGAFDPGLGGFTDQARHVGKFRTPTTRNVAMGTKQVVDFYNTRDVHPVCTDPTVLSDPARWGSRDFGGADCWPPPEHAANLDSKNMGKLGLTTQEVLAIVAYMRAMSDQ
jgi:cytochrome c peroxidase